MFELEVFDRYYNLSLRYLSYRPRSEKEVKDYLHKKQLTAKNLTDEIIVNIINRLKSYNFINDEEFIKVWIGQRRRISNKPTRVIRYELREKGISNDLIDKYLNSDDSKEADLVGARILANKKMDFYRNLDESKRREKVLSFLVRRGYSYDTAKKALDD